MLALLSAMPEEAISLTERVKNPKEHQFGRFSMLQGKLFGREVVFSSSGVGKVLAAILTSHMIERYSPTALLFVGVAGALKAELEQGDIVLGESLVQHDLIAREFGCERGQVPFSDLRFFHGDKRLLELSERISLPGITIRRGRIATGDQFISDSSVAREISSELEADAVEMEGASVAMTCELYGVPHLIARTISDNANESSKLSFEEFLPLASKNACSLLEQLFAQLEE